MSRPRTRGGSCRFLGKKKCVAPTLRHYAPKTLPFAFCPLPFAFCPLLFAPLLFAPCPLPQPFLPSLFGQLDASDVKRLKTLEAENARLKKLLVDRDLEIEVMKEINAKKW